ncbi:MAG: M23 family metallopeptidase, partial [Gemmatimonadota bacterium]
MTWWRRSVSVMIHTDGALKSATYRVPLWGLRAMLAGGIGVAVLLMLALAFYSPVVRQAGRVPGLERDVARLTTDNRRVRELALALDSVESAYLRLRTMVGADIAPDPVSLGTALPIAPAIVVRPASARPTYEAGASVPAHWPLDERGYVTRGQIEADSTEEAHPGLDIAVPIGTLVRAAGGGTVLQTGDEKAYGRFVLLQHPGGYQSMYGHLARIVAVEGNQIRAGEVVGRSGNTGRSSAPHLHFEVRLNGVSVDPNGVI